MTTAASNAVSSTSSRIVRRTSGAVPAESGVVRNEAIHVP
jgi:hypothetical protein